MVLDDDECILGRDGECIRGDDRHHYDMVEVRRMGSAVPQYVKGRCMHRHPVPVESGGELVAYLCPACDSQLPAAWRP